MGIITDFEMWIIAALCVIGATVILCVINLGLDRRREKERVEWSNNYNELQVRYNKIVNDYNDFKEVTKESFQSVTKKFEDQKHRMASEYNDMEYEWRTKYELYLASEIKKTMTLTDAIFWFINSVDRHQANKTLSYTKFKEAIEEIQKIDLQNQMPDDKSNKATEYLFSPNEAPGKPL